MIDVKYAVAMMDEVVLNSTMYANECPREGCRAWRGAPCIEQWDGRFYSVQPHPERLAVAFQPTPQVEA